MCLDNSGVNCDFLIVKFRSKVAESVSEEKYRISWPIRRSVIFSLEILEKNNVECILILVIYWKKTGLLHAKISNHNLFIVETQEIVVTATKIIFMVVFTISQ